MTPSIADHPPILPQNVILCSMIACVGAVLGVRQQSQHLCHQPQSSCAHTWLPDGLGFPIVLAKFTLLRNYTFFYNEF